MLNIAEDGDVEIVDSAFAIADGESVKEALRGMLVGTVASVNNGDIEMVGDEVGGAARGVAHDEAVRLHGVEGVYGVEERFAFFYAGGFGLEIHGVRAETAGGGAEADASERGIFEEGQSDGFAAEGGEFF